MEKNLIDIERVCGLKPPDQEFVEIASDPNFVFVNDPNFSTIRLYDIDGNVINVNSWIECAHYVNGGWSPNNFQNPGDIIFLAITLSMTFGYLILNKYKNRKLR